MKIDYTVVHRDLRSRNVKLVDLQGQPVENDYANACLRGAVEFAAEWTAEDRAALIRRLRAWWFAFVYVLVWALTYASAYSVGRQRGYADAASTMIDSLHQIRAELDARKPE